MMLDENFAKEIKAIALTIAYELPRPTALSYSPIGHGFANANAPQSSAQHDI